MRQLRLPLLYALGLMLLALLSCSETNFESKSKNQKIEKDDRDAQPEPPLVEQENPVIEDPDPIEIIKDETLALTETFENTITEPQKLTVSVSNKLLTQNLKLSNSYSDLERMFDQVDRPLITKISKQGAGGTPITETFKQAPFTGIVDIVVVVDNSRSMIEEQRNLSTKLEPLLTEIKNSDWQIGVVSTSPNDPCLRAVIDRNTANPAQQFSNAVNLGIAGSGNEQGVLRAVEALECTSPKWLRANSSIAILIVSDEDNCSYNGFDCSARAWSSPFYLTDYLKNVLNRKVGEDARVYGLFRHPNDYKCTSALNPAIQYAQLVANTNGTYGSICAADYTATLKEISKNIASILKTQFALKDKPDSGSLKVLVNGNEKADGFVLMDNVVTFTEIPAPGSTITFDYVSGREPQVKRFAMGEAPANGTLDVTVNGKVVPMSDYVIDGADWSIVFKQAPAPSSTVKIVFRSNKPLANAFDIGKSAIASTIKAKINNQNVTDFTYNASQGFVRFGTTPEDGAKIRISYRNLNGPNLEYSFPTIGSSPSDFSAVDKVSGKAVKVTYAGGKLKVDAADHAENKEIVVTYRNADSNKSEVKLPFIPIAGSLKVSSSVTTCKLGHGIKLEGDIVKIDCAVPDATKFDIEFDYDHPLIKEFTMKSVTEPEKGTWTVLVNDVETSDFKREGATIRFDSDLPRGSIIKVTYIRRGDS